MTVFDIDEVETDLPGPGSGPNEVLGQFFDFGVRQARVIGEDAESGIQDRMMVQNFGLQPVLVSGSGKAS